MNTQSISRNVWFWLGFGLLLVIAALAIQNVSRRAATATIPDTGAPVARPQSVPDAAAQGVAGYIDAHSDPSAQAVPEAAVQGVTNYLQAHSTGPMVTDPAQEGVMDYLRAHGAEVP